MCDVNQLITADYLASCVARGHASLAWQLAALTGADGDARYLASIYLAPHLLSLVSGLWPGAVVGDVDWVELARMWIDDVE